MSLRVAIALGIGLGLIGCTGDDKPTKASDIQDLQTDLAASARPIVSSDDDINVDVISVQYGPQSAYIGSLALNVGTGRPRLPDPAEEIFVVVVREPPTEAQMVDFNLQLRPGMAYQWLGESEFREIRPVDLSLTDKQISELFGVGRPSNGQLLVKSLDSREIDNAEVQALLDAADTLNYRDSAGRAAIHVAAYNGHFDVVRQLVERSADVNLPGMGDGRPLQSASAGGNAEIVSYLLDNGAHINAVDAYGESALHSAMQNNGCVECARVLIENGADIGQENGDGKTPITLAQSQPASWMGNQVEMLAYLNTLKVEVESN